MRSTEIEAERPTSLRLFTTVKGKLLDAYLALKARNPLMDDGELLRQALIRLVNDEKERGELVVGNLN